MTDETLRAQYAEAAERVHRAFCFPDHEEVGEWDRSMAEALRSRGLAIVKVDAADCAIAARPDPLDVGALAKALQVLVDEDSGGWHDWLAGEGTMGPAIEGLRVARKVAAAYQAALARRGSAPTLDSAWAEVERLLPEGWSLKVWQSNVYASAIAKPAMDSHMANAVEGHGSTPVEALTNLADALARRGSEG